MRDFLLLANPLELRLPTCGVLLGLALALAAGGPARRPPLVLVGWNRWCLATLKRGRLEFHIPLLYCR